MNHQEFMKKVHEYAGMASADDADRVARAALETLGERLSRVHRQHLAAQLPKELREHALKRTRRERFSLEEFYNRVANRSDAPVHEAMKGARATMCVLHEAVAPRELDDVLAELPREYDELLGTAPLSPLSPTADIRHRHRSAAGT